MRPEKQLLLDEIRQQIVGSTAVILMRYQQMNPNLSATFRASLSNAGGDFEIVRKRILMKAAEAAGFSIDAGFLQGHIGVVFTKTEPTAVAKMLYQFAKDNEEVLEILGARFEGKLWSAHDVKQISELPSQEEMRAQFLSVLEAPLAQTLAVMDALLTSIPYCLESQSSK